MDPRIQEYVNTTLEAARKLETAMEAEKPAPEPKPERKFNIGEWFVYQWNEGWQRCITKIESGDQTIYTVEQYSSRLPPPDTRMRESDFSQWLPIPPKPDVPEGVRLTGEVRVPEKGEGWLGPSSGEYLAWSPTCQPNKDIHGGRRWIAEPEEKHWQDAYKTCPKCREAVEVPEADSVMFECGAWQRRDGVFVPSVQCLQNQADQLKAAQENPHV